MAGIWKHEILSDHQKWLIRRFWSSHPAFRALTYIIVFFIIGFTIGRCTASPEIQEVVKEKQVEKIVEANPNFFSLEASEPHVVGSYGDNLQWSGSNIKVYNGTALLKLDTENRIGSMEIEFDGVINPEEDAVLDGNIKIVMTDFSGQEGIVKDTVLFGDTGRGFEHYPKTKAVIAGFGKADLYLDDSLIFAGFPALFAYSDGIRKPDGRIAKPNGELYNLDETGSVEFFDAGEKELHFMLYSEHYDRANFPNNAVFVNLYFEKVNTKS